VQYFANRFTYISAALHFLIFFAVGIYFNFSKSNYLMGKPAETTINSYIYHSDRPAVLKTKPLTAKMHLMPQYVTQKTPVIEKKALKLAAQKSIKTLAKQTVTEKTEVSSKAGGRSRGQSVSTLLALLHTAIQQHQHYPLSARQMGRHGRATVKFVLLTDGSVNAVRIEKSSGTVSLDQAALAAVHEAAPFTQVKQYLQEPREYSVDVVFGKA
jgi:TonB family protein